MIETIARFKQNQVLLYCKSDKKRTVSDTSKANLIQNKDEKDRAYSGEINTQAQKKVRQIVENWSYAVEEKASRGKKRHNFNRRLTFVTLTLAASQKHSDKEIKRKLLDSFLIKVKKKHDIKHYLWKAELQKNGNVHFHIILDKYIHWRTIRSIWNKIQEKLNYISDFEAKHGHKDANSTDVKSIKSSKIVSFYISKYITKKEKYKECRKLEGRVWGCSDSLRELKYYEKVVNTYIYENFETYNNTDYEFFQILREMQKMDEKSKQIEINEYTEVYCFKQNAIDLYKAWDWKEYDKINNHYSEQIKMLY